MDKEKTDNVRIKYIEAKENEYLLYTYVNIVKEIQQAFFRKAPYIPLRNLLNSLDKPCFSEEHTGEQEEKIFEMKKELILLVIELLGNKLPRF